MVGKGNRSTKMLFRGYQAALLAQVPYTTVLLCTFEYLDSKVFSQDQYEKFDKYDDHPFVFKFLYRFGAATLSLVLAQSLFYPLDTVKRCLQLNASPGHKNLYDGTLFGTLKGIYNNQGLRKGLYAGYSVNLIRCIPLTALQYIVFQSFKALSKPSAEYLNPVKEYEKAERRR